MRQSQVGHLDEIGRLFDGLRRWEAPIHAAEVTGVDQLRAFGLEVYGSHDPLDAEPAPGATSRPARASDLLKFELSLPGVTEDEVQLARSGSVVLVTVGPHRRSVTLPPHLRDRVATGARISNGRLEVEFAR
jgi:arsenite-transporting ATPase